jgi:hypothetical protein
MAQLIKWLTAVSTTEFESYAAAGIFLFATIATRPTLGPTQ